MENKTKIAHQSLTTNHSNNEKMTDNHSLHNVFRVFLIIQSEGI